MKKGRRLEAVGFVVSAVILAFLYGFGVRYFGWFPNSVLSRALREGGRLVTSPDFVAPRVYQRAGARTIREEEMQPGLTLIAMHWEELDWAAGIKLIDAEGKEVHAWRVDPVEAFSGTEITSAAGTGRVVGERAVHGIHLFEDGDVVLNVDYVGTFRMDACGSVDWSLPVGNHHSVERADDGSFWIPAVSRDLRTTTPDHPDGLPGFENAVHHDRILKVSEDGEVLRTINVLDLLYANGLERYLAKARKLDGPADVTHLNDVEPLRGSMAGTYPGFEVGDLLVSLLGLDLVLVVDPESERVKWHASAPFLQQHDPDFIGDGWIGVFDNNRDGTDRGTMLGGSRIVALRPNADSTRILFPTPESEPFYTRLMGKWQLLENGNLLLTESRAGRIVEVAPDGRTVWEWVGEPHKGGGTAEVSEGTRYDLTSEDVSAWPCSSVLATDDVADDG